MLREAGADCVKFEGAQPELMRALTAAGFDVCCTSRPRIAASRREAAPGQDGGGRRETLSTTRWRSTPPDRSFWCWSSCRRSSRRAITQAIGAPTIGIGAGAATDGQVLVVNDLAGITAREFKHNRRYGAVGAALRDAVGAYARDVRAGRFPAQEHAFHMADDERSAFERAARDGLQAAPMTTGGAPARRRRHMSSNSDSSARV